MNPQNIHEQLSDNLQKQIANDTYEMLRKIKTRLTFIIVLLLLPLTLSLIFFILTVLITL